ncbi:MAG: hypothetical protein ACRYE9_02200 [Janthinobacterium lividum]
MKLIVISSCLLLASCASQHHPKMLSFTPASTVIDYSNNDLHEATALAQQFCSSINKDAQYVSHKEEGWVTKSRTAFFNCIESLSKHNANMNHNNGGNSHIPIINNFK